MQFINVRDKAYFKMNSLFLNSDENLNYLTFKIIVYSLFDGYRTELMKNLKN